MFIIYFYTPSESKLIKKFTVTGYLIFIFCSCFILYHCIYTYILPIIKNLSKSILDCVNSRKKEEERIKKLYNDMEKSVIMNGIYRILVCFECNKFDAVL